MKKEGPGHGKGMSKRTMALILLGFVALVAILVLPGCMAKVPSTPVAEVPAYMVHVPGNDHGVVLLVGRSTCPWCMKTKALLSNMSVGFYWVDLNTLDETNTTRVMNAVSICGQVNSVPILIINGRPPCIIGYQEEQIREALS